MDRYVIARLRAAMTHNVEDLNDVITDLRHDLPHVLNYKTLITSFLLPAMALIMRAPGGSGNPG